MDNRNDSVASLLLSQQPAIRFQTRDSDNVSNCEPAHTANAPESSWRQYFIL